MLVVAVMAGLGQGVARIFTKFRPLSAYRLDIAGSIDGILLFSLLSFLNQPPATWGFIACIGAVAGCPASATRSAAAASRGSVQEIVLQDLQRLADGLRLVAHVGVEQRLGRDVERESHHLDGHVAARAVVPRAP